MLDPAVHRRRRWRPCARRPTLPMSTVSLPLTDVEEMLSSAVVKVVTDARGDALYFSRSPIPFVRDAVDLPPRGRRRRAGGGAPASPANTSACTPTGGRRCSASPSLPRRPLEQAESLEQLRALHHGMKIRVVPMEGQSGVAVDTPQDLERVRAMMAGRGPPPTSQGIHGYQIHLRDRRGRLVARQGAGLRLHRRPAGGARVQGRHDEMRPLHQRRPRHHEPVPARRGLRHRRRRGDRPRPRALRALHPQRRRPPLQHHHRQDLRQRDRQGAARRLPGPHRPGDPAHHGRDQVRRSAPSGTKRTS